MNEQLFRQGSLEEAVAALRQDLLAENGPQISTMRNYRFAILRGYTFLRVLREETCLKTNRA